MIFDREAAFGASFSSAKGRAWITGGAMEKGGVDMTNSPLPKGLANLYSEPLSAPHWANASLIAIKPIGHTDGFDR